MNDRVAEVLDIVRRVCALGDYDSNVIGMAAEIIAEDVFGMSRTERGTTAIDGVWWRGMEQRTVQVKAWSEARVRKWRQGTFFRVTEASAADDLLVLLIFSSKAGFKVLYSGPTKVIGQIETDGVNRRIRLDSMQPSQELQKLLRDLGGPPNADYVA